MVVKIRFNPEFRENMHLYNDNGDDDNLESRQTLFKWKIGMTRVAFSSHATATASHICIKSMKKQSNNSAIIFYNK